MPKHLKAVIKECRYLLEKDFAGQLHKREPEPGNYEIDPENAAEERALAFLMELAVLRCFEEQRWGIPLRLSFSSASDHESILERLTSSRNRLRSEAGFLLHYTGFPEITLSTSTSTLKIVLHHLGETISPEEWHAENILGWIYQYFYDNTSEQKQHGKFYTPEPIAEFIVSQVLDTFLDSQNNTWQSCSLLDLGCGSGVFTLRAFDRLYELYKDGHHSFGSMFDDCQSTINNHQSTINNHQSSIISYLLENHLFLVDNDAWACQIAAVNLYLKAKRVEPTCHIRKLNIFCADALQRWENFFPSPDSIKKLFTRKYDCVVGNPPYRVINQLRTPKEVIRLYKSYRSAAFKLNTFALFIERGIELLKPSGLLGMIVPNTLLTQVYFESLRTYILNTSKILRILDTKRMFDNAFVENCILLLQRESNVSERARNVVDCSANTSNGNINISTCAVEDPPPLVGGVRGGGAEQSDISGHSDTLSPPPNLPHQGGGTLKSTALGVRGGGQRASNILQCSQTCSQPCCHPLLTSPIEGEGLSRTRQKIPQRTSNTPGSLQSIARIPQYHFEKAPFKMFNVRINEYVFLLMETIVNGNPKLGEICESHDGVNPGNAKYKLIVSEKLDETCKKVLNGKNIGRYWLKWGGLYVRYKRNLLTKSDNVRWGHQAALASAKILTRQTADRIIGTFDTGEYYTTNSIHTTILKEGVSGFHLKFLLALLNSKLISFYYRKLFPENGQVFSQVKLVNLRQLPLKQVSMEVQTDVVHLVDVLLRERKLIEEVWDSQLHIPPKRAKTNNDKKAFLEYLAHTEMRLCRLREKEEKLDQRIYELYQLTPEQIQMIEREMGNAICLYPRVSVDELRKNISWETFQRHYCGAAQTLFQMAERYRTHPESLLELRKEYGIFRKKELRRILSM